MTQAHRPVIRVSSPGVSEFSAESSSGSSPRKSHLTARREFTLPVQGDSFHATTSTDRVSRSRTRRQGRNSEPSRPKTMFGWISAGPSDYRSPARTPRSTAAGTPTRPSPGSRSVTSDGVVLTASTDGLISSDNSPITANVDTDRRMSLSHVFLRPRDDSFHSSTGSSVISDIPLSQSWSRHSRQSVNSPSRSSQPRSGLFRRMSSGNSTRNRSATVNGPRDFVYHHPMANRSVQQSLAAQAVLPSPREEEEVFDFQSPLSVPRSDGMSSGRTSLSIVKSREQQASTPRPRSMLVYGNNRMVNEAPSTKPSTMLTPTAAPLQTESQDEVTKRKKPSGWKKFMRKVLGTHQDKHGRQQESVSRPSTSSQSGRPLRPHSSGLVDPTDEASASAPIQDELINGNRPPGVVRSPRSEGLFELAEHKMTSESIPAR